MPRRTQKFIRTKPGTELNRPLFVGAFRGWNDGGRSPSDAILWLKKHLKAEKIGELNTEAFYIFTENRPYLKYKKNKTTRKISWPRNTFYRAYIPELDRDLLLFLGTEPDLLWQTFSHEMKTLLEEWGVEDLVLLGGFMADVLYSLPVQVYGSSSHSFSVLEEEGVKPNNYEGPTGIVGVLQAEFMRRKKWNCLSLWAAVPYYISVPNPKGIQALLEMVQKLFDLPLDTSSLERAASKFDTEVNNIVAKDPRIAAYVRDLKKREFLN